MRITSILLLLFISPSVIAQSDSVRGLDEITVTATRIKSPVNRVSFAVTRLSPKWAQTRNDRTIPEALSGLPGLYVQKTNHGGGSPFVRGMTGNHTLMMVDGFRLNNSIFRYGPNQYLTLFDPQLIGEVEVVKGTGSVQYGSDALGGVINVVSIVPSYTDRPRWVSKTSLRGTTSGIEWSVRPFLQYSNKKVAAYAAFSHSDFGDLRGGDTTGFQRPSGYTQSSFDARLHFKKGELWDFNFGASGHGQWMVPLYHRYRLERFKTALSDPLKRGILFSRIRRYFDGGVLRQLKLDLSAQGMSERRLTQSSTAVAMTRESDRVGTGSILLEAQFDKSYLWKSSISLEYNRDMVRSGRENTLPDGSVTARRGLYPDRSQYANAAISNTHRVDLDPWQFELGWRFHSYAISMYDTTMGNISIKPSAWVYFAGTSLRLKKDWVLFMNVNTGYRAPNIDDMGTVGIVDFRYEVPAYDLRPERSLNKEIGIRYLAPKTRISASLFHTGFKDLIARVKTNETVGNYFVYVKQNVEESYIWGAETEGRVSAGQRLEFSANLTYLFGHNITRDEPMRRIPPLNGTLFVRYKTKPLQFNLEMEKAGWQRRLAQGDKDDKRIPMGGTPGYTLFHISAVGECKAIQYRILLYNLFNRDFRTHGSGINGMGRSLSATLVFTFASQK